MLKAFRIGLFLTAAMFGHFGVAEETEARNCGDICCPTRCNNTPGCHWGNGHCINSRDNFSQEESIPWNTTIDIDRPSINATN